MRSIPRARCRVSLPSPGAGRSCDRAGDAAAGAVRELGLQRPQVASGADDPAAFVDGAEVHAQVRGHALVVEVGGGDQLVREGLDAAGERLLERARRQAAVRLRPLLDELGTELLGPVGGGDHVATDRLGEGAQQARHQLGTQAGNLPVEAAVLDLREERQRHDHAHAVVVGARLEPIREAEHLVALGPPGRELALIRTLLVVDQVALAHHEQLRRRRHGLSPPALERPHVEHLGGDALVVEAEHGFVAGEDVAATLALLELLEALAQFGVAAPERAHPLVDPCRIPLALDESVPHEQLA